jgi:alpha-2-macroglobulin
MRRPLSVYFGSGNRSRLRSRASCASPVDDRVHSPFVSCFRLFCLVMPVLLALFVAPAAAQRTAAPHRPALDLFVYRRSHTTDETVKLRLSAFNQTRVEFSVFRLSLPRIVQSSRSLETIAKTLKAVNVASLPQVRQWRYAMGKSYPDQWTERELNVPHLGPGVYLVRARGGGAERRTWLAVTDIAVLSKRSRQELLVFAASIHSGKPVSGLQLAMLDAGGHAVRGATDGSGVLRTRRADDKTGKEANIWIYGEQSGQPAFLLAGAPPPPPPYTVYMYTDRPIYRPGHTIQYRGTVRQRLESDGPGGFSYRPYAGQDVTVEIRDSTDALLDRRSVRTNSFGTFDGTFKLAAEPPLGRWQLIAIVGGQRSYAGMEVQAYRKPEYTVAVQTPLTHVVGGATVPITIEGRYFFGQPVANAAVQYQIQFAPESGGGEPGAAEPPFAGQGVLDASGRLRIDVPTKRLPFNRRLTVSATVTDLSRRSRQAAGDVLVTSGAFRVTVAAERSLYHPGDRLNVLVHTEDYDGHPIAARVRVRLIESKEDARHRPYKETTTRDIVTDAAGSGTAVFTPPRPGYLELSAEAFDAQDNKIAAAGSVWVAGDEIAGYDYPDLNLVPDRASYRPGETATVLVNTSLVTPPRAGRKRVRVTDPDTGKEVVHREYPAAWALVTVQGERLYEHRVVRITSRSSTLRVPLSDRYFPSVRLSVAIVQERHIYEQDVPLVVARDQQRLSVTVAPDREKYAPGDEAAYTITTRDYRGRPVAAEVGLGVVDASIYAVRPDDTPDPEEFFYGGQEVRVHTDFSFSAQYSGGAAQTVPQARKAPEEAKPDGARSIRVRRQFADTAIWRPAVATGADGTAQVRFTLPDNLTTWRATARGISTDTAVGAATHDVVSSLPLLVRLSLPRFYVEGDEAVVSAIVHNYTDTARSVTAHIASAGASIEGDAVRTFTLAPGGEERLDWRAKVAAPFASNTGSASEAGAARFTITADGGPGGQDAAEITLPVMKDGLAQVDVRAETLGGRDGEVRVDLSALPKDATVTVTQAPSLAAATFDALDYLTSYPYGCAEQTMSSFLPDVAVARTLKRLGAARTVHADLTAWVNAGLQKLYRYQHSDGGWNWWEFDQTDGDMTAYVLWGLVQARDAGYLVDDQRILRGTEALITLLGDEREWNRRADWMLTLAYARPESIAKAPPGKPSSPLGELYQNRSKLDAFGQASLCLALAKVGGAFGPEAAGVARELEAKAVVIGTTAHWPAADGGYTWRSDDAGVTAHVLRAMLTADPKSTIAPAAVRWLMGNRTGKAWESTRSSAEAVFALAQYMEQSGELRPDYRTEIALDGTTVATTAWTPAKASDDPVRELFTPERLRGHTALTIRKQGDGVLYTTVQIAYTVPSASATSGAKGISVRRYYHVTAEDPSHADTIASGQDVEVTVEVTANANYRYAILEEPIPAGCEVAPPDETYRPWGLSFESGAGYVRQEVRDNRVVFFFSDLPKGRATFTYRLHAETPGTYRILPSVASLVYFPEIRGNSAPVRARIGER